MCKFTVWKLAEMFKMGVTIEKGDEQQLNKPQKRWILPELLNQAYGSAQT